MLIQSNANAELFCLFNSHSIGIALAFQWHSSDSCHIGRQGYQGYAYSIPCQCRTGSIEKGRGIEFMLIKSTTLLQIDAYLNANQQQI